MIWRALGKASFATVSHVTPSGQPRSSGVLYTVTDRRLYVVTGVESWKAKHIAATGHVAVTVPVRRGGLLSLLAPIPPATISFHGRAVVHPACSLDDGSPAAKLVSRVPPERRAESRVIEIAPEGDFVCYGIGVPLLRMRDPAQSRARVAVS
ncbi:pyridoxamine 5'-phosphate oxidase family protein [Pseudofrankia saprophytica]|uniref:pyridoxamine 5'-phosphate oxidase family protein n=1 Tax=Pseudofrankia saprophytica TaxID=298655 RepID=UPI00030C104D|nr:pyridoxamine 5'-phosphate oxidase family protein [Pseudofrankia saprophytica]